MGAGCPAVTQTSEGAALTTCTTRWLRGVRREMVVGALPRAQPTRSGRILRNLVLVGLKLMTTDLPAALFTCVHCMDCDGRYKYVSADSIWVGFGSGSDHVKFQHITEPVPENERAIKAAYLVRGESVRRVIRDIMKPRKEVRVLARTRRPAELAVGILVPEALPTTRFKEPTHGEKCISSLLSTVYDLRTGTSKLLVSVKSPLSTFKTRSSVEAEKRAAACKHLSSYIETAAPHTRPSTTSASPATESTPPIGAAAPPSPRPPPPATPTPSAAAAPWPRAPLPSISTPSRAASASPRPPPPATSTPSAAAALSPRPPHTSALSARGGTPPTPLPTQGPCTPLVVGGSAAAVPLKGTAAGLSQVLRANSDDGKAVGSGRGRSTGAAAKGKRRKADCGRQPFKAGKGDVNADSEFLVGQVRGLDKDARRELLSFVTAITVDSVVLPFRATQVGAIRQLAAHLHGADHCRTVRDLLAA